MSRNGAIALGLGVALVGVVIVAVAFFGSSEKFHAPRWVVASIGGAFFFFGGWLAAAYALGYDPRRPQQTLPSAKIQLVVLIPGLLLFAAPFHWIAFGRGPRAFSSTFSLPFLSVSGRASEMSGRLMFGFGALLIDAMMVTAVIRLLRSSRQGGTMTSPTPSDGSADSP
jgi:drug/metabolite transporter (DMT)-like permease